MSFPFRITPTSVTIHMNGRTYVLTEDSHQHYTTIREAIRNKEFDKVEPLIDLAREINSFGKGKIQVVNGVVMYGDYEIHNTLTKRILEQIAEGFDVEPMIKFLENLMENPSKRAVDELFDFLEACDLPITDDGHFVAYKKVRNDYMDIYTGKIRNAIGDKPSMARNMVDEEKARTCSAGLHFASESYLSHYSSFNSSTDRVMIVKINPRDVVAIPADYNNAKGRCCLYEVVGEADPKDLKFYKGSVYSVSYGDDDFGDSDDCDDDYGDFGDEGDDILNLDDDEGCDSCGTCTNADCSNAGAVVIIHMDADEPTDEELVDGVVPNKPIKTLAAEYGYTKHGSVKVKKVDGEYTVLPYDSKDPDAVLMSAETKSVRSAIKLAVLKRYQMENTPAVSVAPQVDIPTGPGGVPTGISNATTLKAATSNLAAIPVVPAMTLTKSQVAAVMFGNGAALDKVDEAVKANKVTVHATANGLRYTINK